MAEIKTFWQPVLPHAEPSKVINVETFIVEGIKFEIMNHDKFKNLNWEETDWAIRVCVKFKNIDLARNLLATMKQAGLVAIRNWVE